MNFIMEFLMQRLDYTVLSILMLVYCVICYVAFSINMDMLPSLSDTPLFRAFEDSTIIYFGITVNISTCIPTVMDLIIDMKNFRDEEDIDGDSWIERFFLAALSIIPGSVVLLLRKDVNIPYIYVILHTLQTLGSIGMVLLICKKQVPKYFTTSNIVCTMINCTLLMITSIIGFGHGILYWSNILFYVFMCGACYFLIGRLCIPWMRDIWVNSISKNKSLSVQESCAMWYFMNTMILMIVHTVVCSVDWFVWTSYDRWDVIVFVYTFALNSVVNSTVPGRLAKIAVEKSRKKIVETKRALIRYLSHEVRSILNVIHSGLNLLVEDVEQLPPNDEKNKLLETFASIRHASGDLLLLESMDSPAFSVEEEMVPCASLTEIAEKCSLMPCEKGIVFTVNNQFDEKDRVPDGQVVVDEQVDHLNDIELGCVHKDPDADKLLFIDKHKIGQVLRNLITNSSKFTPAGQTISVNIRNATSAYLTETTDSSYGEDEDIVDWRRRAMTFAQENCYAPCGEVLVEVKDTGVGIAPANWGKVFGQFAQFDANKLQGGGGSGLGLWICQQLVKLHGSKVRFHSDGEGCGTRFFFTLPSYKKTQEAMFPAVPLQTLAPTLLSLTIRGAQISPETSSVGESAARVATEDKFFRITPRSLSNRGVCKVLLVDDSSFNVKVMKNILKKVTTSWPCTLPMESMNEGTVLCEPSNVLPKNNDRSSLYLPPKDTTTPSLSPVSLTSNRTCVVDKTLVVVDYSEADDGAVAVQMVQAARDGGAPFDIVFMDNIMTLMHGPEAAQAMRAAGFTGLIIGVTGNVMAEDVHHYIQSRADHILAKPVNIEYLKQILKRLTY